MPNESAPQPTRRRRMATVVLLATAFLYGNYLMGAAVGVVYVLMAGTLLFLFGRALEMSGRARGIRLAVLALIAGPVVFGMAFPAKVHPGFQSVIDGRLIEQVVSAELVKVLDSEAAFRDLRVSTTRGNALTVTISGSVPTRDDLQRLRAQFTRERLLVVLHHLHWDVELRDTGESVRGVDPDLFPPSQPAGLNVMQQD